MAIIKNPIDEMVMYANIKDMVMKGLDHLKMKRPMDYDDVILLEKYAKIYAVLKDDLREDLKSGVWEKLQPES